MQVSRLEQPAVNEDQTALRCGIGPHLLGGQDPEPWRNAQCWLHCESFLDRVFRHQMGSDGSGEQCRDIGLAHTGQAIDQADFVGHPRHIARR